jgi:16S rRNA (cytosine1402-N4)-methyltransferase
VDEKELRQVLKRYGEEPFATRIAKAVIAARSVSPIETTAQLADIVSNAVPRSDGKRHPATRAFQAIRIMINDELGQLERGLEQAVRVLAPHGRLCVISFHSLEDRIVKRFMRDESREPEQYRGMPEIPEALRPRLRLVGKPVSASDEEVGANMRSRSARLRVAERAA